MSTAANLLLRLSIAIVGGFLIGRYLGGYPLIAIPLALAFGFFVPTAIIKAIE